MALEGRVVIRRSADRFTTLGDGVRTRHLLSFGDHYDPGLISLGPLVAYNDEVVEPGSGYPPHRHRGVDIVSWVVAGRLVHRDPVGEAVLGPGSAQLLSAGSGVLHEEMGGQLDGSDEADPLTAPRPLGATRFVQMWLTADDQAAPRHSFATFDDIALTTRLVPIATGEPSQACRAQTAPLKLRAPGTACYAGRVPAGAARELPSGAGVHVYVVGGSLDLGGIGTDVRLGVGDSVLLTEPSGAECVARADAEIVVWTWEA